WSDGLEMFKASPIFGVGVEEFAKNAGQVAHNAYMHSFAEIGLFGGMFFVGACYFALRALNRLGSPSVLLLDPDMERLRPYLMAAFAGYAAGLLSLSNCYEVPTYT